MSLEKLKESGKPLICLEVNPPRGVEASEVFQRLDGKLNGVDFLNITDSALARMRMSPFPFAAHLKQRFKIEPLVNLSCRDRNLIAVQAELLGAWFGGLRSIVALTGDAVSIGDDPQRKGVFETNSLGLLNVISTLNSGKDLAGNELKGAPQFLAGVVLNPNANNSAAEIKRLTKKREAGAAYALSQPVFDAQSSQRFFKEAASAQCPIFMGLLPLRNAKAARSVTEVPGIKISEAIQARIENDAEGDWSDFSIAHCIELARLNRPLVAGFHIISGSSPRLAVQLVQELARLVEKGLL